MSPCFLLAERPTQLTTQITNNNNNNNNNYYYCCCVPIYTGQQPKAVMPRRPFAMNTPLQRQRVGGLPKEVLRLSAIGEQLDLPPPSHVNTHVHTCQ